MPTPRLQEVQTDVLRDFEQPGRETGQIASVMSAGPPCPLESAARQLLDVSLASQSEAKVVVDARRLVGIDGIPVQLLRFRQLSHPSWCCLFEAHACIYRPPAEVSHRVPAEL